MDCIKCDGKLMYLKSFRINYGITVNGQLFQSDTTQFYWVCSCCSRLYFNTLENPELKLYQIQQT